MSLKKLAAVVGVACLAAACASGGRSSENDREAPIRALLSADTMVFVSFDADGDLQTTTAEIDAGLTREFTRADANHDGSLQPIEFQNWGNSALGGGYVGPFRLDFDRNVDNVITREEFDAEIRARAESYDENEDGVLTRSDFVRRIGQARTPTQRAPQRQYGQPR
jgi:hypothetical protein